MSANGWPKADWVRIGPKGLLCEHCGDAYPVSMPVDLDVLIAMSKAYARRHKNCPEPSGTSGEPS